jgi:hypothetical protein
MFCLIKDFDNSTKKKIRTYFRNIYSGKLFLFSYYRIIAITNYSYYYNDCL